MKNYKFIVQSPDGSTVYESPYTGITITEELNKGISGSINIAYPDLKKYANSLNVEPDNIFATQKMEWYLKIDEVDFMGGVFTNRSITGKDTGMTTYSVSFADFSTLLEKRRTELLFQRLSTDSATIANDLLDFTNGVQATGITIGSLPATVDRDLTAKYAEIRGEIVSLSNLKKKGGYDWEVSVTKKLNLYFPEKGDTNMGIIFDEFNSLSFNSTRLLQANLTNKVIVIGKDGVVASRENASSQTTWDLMEDTLSETGVGTVAGLESRGDKFIDDNAFPSDVISISHVDGTPDMTSYNVGDTVRLIRSELDIDVALRIYKRSIKISPGGQAVIGLYFI